MGGMSDKGNESARPPMFVSVAALATIILIPCAYVLSVGPAAWLFANHYLSDWAYVSYVTPLVFVRELCPPFSEALNWYLAHWV